MFHLILEPFSSCLSSKVSFFNFQCLKLNENWSLGQRVALLHLLGRFLLWKLWAQHSRKSAEYWLIFWWDYRLLCRERSSPSTWDRRGSRQEMLAGSSFAWSTTSVLTACLWTTTPNRTLVTTRSTLSFILGAPGATSPEPYTWTWSPRWSVSSSVGCRIQTSWFRLIQCWMLVMKVWRWWYPSNRLAVAVLSFIQYWLKFAEVC